tara:strand:- start:578 stop:844 length:267 start_codon:yes stop_codon:yes gene_type:complete
VYARAHVGKRIQNSRAHSPNINSTHLQKDFVGAMTREEESVAAIILFSISFFKVTYTTEHNSQLGTNFSLDSFPPSPPSAHKKESDVS